MKALHLLTALLFAGAAHAAPLKLFTDRPKDRLDQALTGFTAQTGIAVEITVAPYAELKAKIQGGEKADVLLVKDLTLIMNAVQSGLFTPMSEANRKADVDPSMRDAQGLWTALAYRIRTVAIDPAIVSKDLVRTYESLSGPNFSGQLCMRNLKDYMPTFVAWLISRYGEAKAQAMVEGWKANLAVGFTAGDTASFQAIENGTCLASIGNHYYLARLKAADARFPVELAFADQNEGGLHTNGFGGGVVNGTQQSDKANAFLNYMLSSAGQKALTAAPSFEYPAVKTVNPEAVVVSFGQFKISDVHWTDVGAQIDKANAILERAEWAK